MDIIFYNHFHNGDIHFSRPFISHIMNELPQNNFFYDISDYSNLNNLDDILHLQISRGIVGKEYENDVCFKKNNKIYINTWIGCDDKKHLMYGNGCNAESNKSLYKKIFNFLNLNFPEKFHFIPKINYNAFKIDNIKQHIEQTKNKKRILFCNGLAHSGQSINFPMFNLINLACEKNYIVYYTNREPFNISNDALFTTSLIGKSAPDLNEISYLSTFCDVIVGRSSGPHVYTFVEENINRKNLINITFTNSEKEKTYCEGLCKNIWSNSNYFIDWVNIVKDNI